MQVLGLAIQENVPNPAVKLRSFRQKHGITYPLLSDEKTVILSKFGFNAIPANAIIDRNGRYVGSAESVPEIVKKIARLTR